MVVAFVAIGGCSAQAVSTAAPTQTIVPTAVVTPIPTVAPISAAPISAAPTPGPSTGLSGQAALAEAMMMPGSLGMTLAQFVSRWNSVLDQGQYPLEGAPERSGATFMFTPEGAANTKLLGVLNDDGSVRAVDAISVAEGISDDIDRDTAQLEALTIWSTLARAVNPRLTEAEGNMVLTDLGLTGVQQFGLLPPLVLDLKGVRYYVIEGDTTTNFVARPSD